MPNTSHPFGTSSSNHLHTAWLNHFLPGCVQSNWSFNNGAIFSCVFPDYIAVTLYVALSESKHRMDKFGRGSFGVMVHLGHASFCRN
jgi:hypothetical protein